MKIKNEKNTKNEQENPFKGIKLIVILVLLFVLVVTIGVFYLLYIYKGARKTDIDSLGNMQSATLAISAISVSFISGIVTILVFYRERKTELLNSMVKTNLSKVEKERDFLSRLLYLQSNNSRYLLGLQYDYLKNIGNDICDSDVDSKHQFLYIICSLLESRIAEPNDKDINIQEIYDQITKFSKKIIDDESIRDEMKTDAIFMYVNAHYKIFREDLVTNPDCTNSDHLDKAIICLTQYRLSEIASNIKASSAQFNLMGLVYYWKYNYLSEKHINNDVEKNALIEEAVNYFKKAKNKNGKDEQIRNNYGCGLIGMGKCYVSMGKFNISDYYYKNAALEFQLLSKEYPTYEKPFINLIDICCLKIKSILKIKSDIYLLKPVISRKGNFDGEIRKQIDIGQSYYESAKQSGKLLYNVYYKIAELEIFRLLLSFRMSDGEAAHIKETIIDCLNKSTADKTTVKSLKKKRQFFELCGNSQGMNEINSKIMEIDRENAEAWDSLIKESECAQMQI